MLRFVIIPLSPDFPPTELIAHDAAGVLHLVERMGCKAADVERDGAHAFSVSLSDSGMWSISPRRLAAHTGEVQAGLTGPATRTG